MPHVLYVTLQAEDTILIYDLDPESGALTHRRAVAAPGGPAPLCTNPEQTLLYGALRGANQLATWAIDVRSGDLERVGTTELRSDPNFLSTDRTGRFLFSAYYGAGMCAVHPIGPDGVPLAQGAHYLETARAAHCIHPHRNNRFVYLPHVMPHNAIHQYLFDAETGALSPNDPPLIQGSPGQGPRHYVYHPTLDMLYTSNEQGCSVTAYRIAPDSGALMAAQTHTTLPIGWEGKNSCAQIRIHPSGRYLYVSNRGHDSLAMYAIAANGSVTWLGAQPSERTPRAFNLDPSGRFLYAAGFDSGYLAAYAIGQGNGRLSPLARYAVGEHPMWVLPLAL